jgi:hypothetical protein
MKAHRLLVCMCVALCQAPFTAGAQQPAAPEWNGKYAHPKPYSCVDPTDVLVRRRFQDEPCKLPMYDLPVAGSDGSPRWPAYPPRAAGTEGDPMFWRFPVQPIGPHEAPRHSRR